MASNPYVNKVVYGGSTLIDLTDATITSANEADKILSGYTAYAANGSKVTGTCAFTVDATDVTATQSEVLASKTFAKGTTVLTGTMANNGAISAVITNYSSAFTVPIGFHDGTGTVSVSSTNFSPGNIKSGITILGVTGTYTGESITTQNKTVIPTASQQTVTADAGYDYLATVTVEAVPYAESDNAAGGKTVTILGS